MQKINVADHYPAKLKKELTRFNADVDALQAARAAVDSDRAGLTKAATAGKLTKPGNLLADAQALRARAAELDHRELSLLNQKPTFTPEINAAKSVERDKVLAQAETRRSELHAQLTAVTASKFIPALILEDPQITALRNRAEDLRHNITERDRAEMDAEKARAAELAQKLAELLR